MSTSLVDAFARFGATLESPVHGRSAIADDGALVISCSIPCFRRPGPGVLRYEDVLSRDPRVGTYCFGDTPGLADLCLVPQVYGAERMKCDLTDYPTIRRLTANARTLAAFQAAAPALQPDAE